MEHANFKRAVKKHYPESLISEGVDQLRQRLIDKCEWYPIYSIDHEYDDNIITDFGGFIIIRYMGTKFTILYNGINYIWCNDKNDDEYRGNIDDIIHYIKTDMNKLQ